VIDSLFLPTLALAIAVLGALNLTVHVLVHEGCDPAIAIRAIVALYVLLVCHIGGRIIPSFTRNYLAKQGAIRLPAPMSRFDHISLGAALLAGLAWAAFPDSWDLAEPLLLILHVAYACIPMGFLGLALSGLGGFAAPSALHLLTVGAIGTMTFAVMTRAARGHTGRPLAASGATAVSYACLLAAATLRPLAELAPDFYYPLLALSAVCWVLAFGLFVAEHASMLVSPSLARQARRQDLLKSAR
jgi:uncharacterized protein involved in response to NO